LPFGIRRRDPVVGTWDFAPFLKRLEVQLEKLIEHLWRLA